MTDGDTGEFTGEWTALADAVRIVKGWQATARGETPVEGDELAQCRTRHEAALRADGAAEVIRRIRSALGGSGLC